MRVSPPYSVSVSCATPWWWAAHLYLVSARRGDGTGGDIQPGRVGARAARARDRLSPAPVERRQRPFAAVPRGSTGVGLTPASFVATAGTRNMTSLGSYSSLVSPSRRVGVLAGGDIDIARNVTGYAEFLFSDTKTTAFGSPDFLVNALVPASNAFNPFGVNVTASGILAGLGSRRYVSNNQTQRWAVGVRGTSSRFDWEISGLTFVDHADFTELGGVDAAKLAAALASSDPAGAFNPFQDGPGGSPALLASIAKAPVTDRDRSKALQLSAVATWRPVALPGGSLAMVAGVERRTRGCLI